MIKEALDVIAEIFDSLSDLLPTIEGWLSFVPSFLWPLVSVYLIVSITYLFVGRS